ncbi:MAG TPA: NifU family protein [Chthoniobacterales bacterium]|nr:NifU family protein [Chthoniobacterales bacterium]
MDKPQNREIQGRLARIEELIQAVDSIADEKARAQARELVEALLEMQGSALERLMEIVYDSGPTGQATIDELGSDELVSSLLLVHGLHPLDLESRVRGALEKVGPRLAQHGGSVEFLGVSREGALRLRLAGNCHGCPSSILTLKFSIEEAIYAAAPDITSLEVEGATPLEPHRANGTNGTAPVTPQFTECPST